MQGKDTNSESGQVLINESEKYMLSIEPKVLPSSIPGAGFGLFATRDYDQGDFVTRYGGVEITEEDHIKNHHRSEYVIRTRSGALIDAVVVLHPLKEKGRWINDARGTKFLNNCFWYERNRGLLFVLTLSPVKMGEEFFIDYGDKYWENRPDDPIIGDELEMKYD